MAYVPEGFTCAFLTGVVGWGDDPLTVAVALWANPCDCCSGVVFGYSAIMIRGDQVIMSDDV